jgi:hypothetical protein
MNICDIYYVRIIYFGIILDCILILADCIFFWKVHFTAIIMLDFLWN